MWGVGQKGFCKEGHERRGKRGGRVVNIKGQNMRKLHGLLASHNPIKTTMGRNVEHT